MSDEELVVYGVAADDRKEGEFESEEIPEDVTGMERRYLQSRGARPTAAALEALWVERDRLYEALENPLTPVQIKRVREYRTLEVRSLHPREQVGTNLATRALTWRPPR